MCSCLFYSLQQVQWHFICKIVITNLSTTHVLKSWYQSKSSDILWFISWLCPSTGNNHSETWVTEAPCADSHGCRILVPFSWGSSLSSQFHTPVKMLWSSFLCPEPPWRTQSLSALFWITLMYTPPNTPVWWLWPRRHQDKPRLRLQKKPQTNGDKISFSLEAKGWAM